MNCNVCIWMALLLIAVTEGSYVVFYMGADDLRSHDYFYCYKVLVQGKRTFTRFYSVEF